MERETHTRAHAHARIDAYTLRPIYIHAYKPIYLPSPCTIATFYQREMEGAVHSSLALSRTHSLLSSLQQSLVISTWPSASRHNDLYVCLSPQTANTLVTLLFVFDLIYLDVWTNIWFAEFVGLGTGMLVLVRRQKLLARRRWIGEDGFAWFLVLLPR